MNIRPETLKTELDQVAEIVNYWREWLEKGVPGEELPANDLDIEIFENRIKGELSLCSERLAAIVEVIS